MSVTYYMNGPLKACCPVHQFHYLAHIHLRNFRSNRLYYVKFIMEESQKIVFQHKIT